MRQLQVLLVLAATVLVAAGCGDDPPPKTGGDISPPVQPQPKGDTATPTSGSVQIEDKIVKACGDLPTAHFSFDSANIADDAATALDALARCFISGPLKGRGMKLVGHADPRGETEYNLALGQRRAGSVMNFLTKKGMEQAKVASSSKGEFEATGIDESGWARDRKVEVLLAD